MGKRLTAMAGALAAKAACLRPGDVAQYPEDGGEDQIVAEEEAPALPALLQALYGGLTRDPPWEAFLQDVAAATEASFATLIIAAGRTGINALVTPGVDPVRAGEYERLSDADPFVDLPEGQVVSYKDFVRYVPSRFQDWMDSVGSAQILGVDLHAPSGASFRLRVTRDQSLPDFTDRESDLLAGLVPHLRIALNLHARLMTTQAERQVFSSAMAGLAVATLVLARDGGILRRNALADQLLQDGAVIREAQGRVAPVAPAGMTILQRLLATPPQPGEEARIDLPAPDGGALRGRAVSLPSSLYGDGACIALFLTSPERSGGPDPATLRDRFQLTPAEAALAARLAQGISLIDAARALDIAHNTARAHLRAIFAKTGTHRQAQLVHLMRTAMGEG